MAKIGYARVSTDDQIEDSQIVELEAEGCERIFTDHGVSGKHASRPELDNALAYLRPGDVFVITRLSRAMRSLRQLLNLVHDFEERGVTLKVLKQQIDTSTPQGRFMFNILASVDEFQRELIVEGTKEGLKVAKAKGHLEGRKPTYTPNQVKTARNLHKQGDMSAEEIGKVIGVSRATVYRMIKEDAGQNG